MVTVEELIDWLNAESSDAETIEDLRDAAVVYVEEHTGLYFGTSGEVVQTFAAGSWPLALRGEPEEGADFTLERWTGSAWEAVDTSAYYVEGAFVRQAASALYATETPARMRATYTTGVATGLAPKPLQVAVRKIVQMWFDGDESEEGWRRVHAILRVYARVTV